MCSAMTYQSPRFAARDGGPCARSSHVSCVGRVAGLDCSCVEPFGERNHAEARTGCDHLPAVLQVHVLCVLRISRIRHHPYHHPCDGWWHLNWDCTHWNGQRPSRFVVVVASVEEVISSPFVSSGSNFLVADLIGVVWNTVVIHVVMYLLYLRFMDLRLAHAKSSLAPEVAVAKLMCNCC
jgi:hypothetical protein